MRFYSLKMSWAIIFLFGTATIASSVPVATANPQKKSTLKLFKLSPNPIIKPISPLIPKSAAPPAVSVPPSPNNPFSNEDDVISPVLCMPKDMKFGLVPSDSLEALQARVTASPRSENALKDLAFKLADEDKVETAQDKVHQAVDLLKNQQEFRKIGDIFYDFASVLEDQNLKRESYANAVNAYQNSILLLSQGKQQEPLEGGGWKGDFSLAQVYDSLGRSLEGLGKTNEAVNAYKKAIKSWPVKPEPLMPGLYFFDKYLLGIGKIDEAIVLYQNLLQQAPDNTGFTDRIIELQKINQKMIEYKKAIQGNPNDLNLYLKWAQDTEVVGHQAYSEIATRYKAVPGTAGKYKVPRWGKILEKGCEPELALIIYQKEIAVNPQNAPTFEAMGKILQSQNRLKEATAAYREAMKLDPSRYSGYRTIIDTLEQKTSSLSPQPLIP